MNIPLPLGVCVLPEKGLNQSRTVSYPDYIFEVLDHAGLFHTKLAIDEIEGALEQLSILVTIGEAELPESLRGKLARWVEGGGAWLSIAGICGMEEVLGVTRREPDMWSWAGGLRSLGEGYLVSLAKSHPVLADVRRPLHLFGGVTVVAKGAQVLARVDDKHGRETDRPGLLENRTGKGRAMLLAVNLTGTIVPIQQGISVTRDGVPAPDGSAPIDDIVLKADDGSVLDWDLDRDPVPTMENFKAFLEPMADLWREVFLRCIFYLAQEYDVKLLLLWLYPRRLPALAHMSHDSDGNEPEKAEDLLRLLDEGGIKTTWCVIVPGYDSAFINKIKAAGHELATHFDAISEGLHWSKAEWQRQYRELEKLFGLSPISNKNHLARWENDTEFWEWCVELGIQLDQTKAVSKTGECGFNFGTAHPYFPVTYRGQKLDCLELCTHVWDLIAFAPVITFATLLESVKRHHGILHQLFHPFHTIRPEIGQSLLESVQRAKDEGMEWWTAKQINDWERARREVRVESFTRDTDSVTVTLRASQTLSDATILCFGGDKRSSSGDSFTAWGFSFVSMVKTLESGKPLTIKLEN